MTLLLLYWVFTEFRLVLLFFLFTVIFLNRSTGFCIWLYLFHFSFSFFSFDLFFLIDLFFKLFTGFYRVA